MKTRFLRGNTTENNGLTLANGELAVDLERKAVRLHDGSTPGGFEMVGSQAVSLPPGPQTLLAGDTTAGVYGEVNSGILPTGQELATEIGLSGLTLTNSDVPYLKFSYQGKTLYVPSKPFGNGPWEPIYEAGAWYGDGTTGTYPSSNPTVQDAVVTRGEFQYKVRLMTGTPPDLVVGEYNKLIRPVVYKQWAGLTSATTELTVPSFVMDRNMPEDDSWPNYRRRGYYNPSYQNPEGFDRFGDGNWLPVLELVE